MLRVEYLRSEVWAILRQHYAMALDMAERQAELTPARFEAKLNTIPGPKGVGDVGIVRISGFIAQRDSRFLQWFGGTSSESIVREVREAMSASSVGAVVLDVDSPGGLVQGTPEAAASIRALRGQKPIIAVANTLAASAAYWLASQADKVVAAPSALVGSIGVFAEHTDMSGALASLGLKPTLVSYGRRKTEGNPYEPLTDEARLSLQERVDTFGRMFEADVAAGRGVKVDTVREKYGEGSVMTAQQALQAGVVDEVGTMEEVLASIGKLSRAIRRERAFDESEILARRALAGIA